MATDAPPIADSEASFVNVASTTRPITSPDTPSKHARIHFPVDEPASSRSDHSTAESSRKSSPFAVKPLQVRQSSPLRPFNASQSGRRRVRSVQGIFTQSHRPNRAPEVSLISPLKQRKEPGSEVDDLGHGVLSDEYDLSHEDPKILQDVQRALKLKARREARLKSGQSIHPLKDIPLRSDVASGTSFSSDSPSIHPPLIISSSTPTALTKSSTSMTSEIDFSPSTRIPRVKASLHPVPSSLDDGATLDWTASGSEDEKPEKRWSLSIHKSKGKEQAPYLSDAAIEKQEARYAEMVDRIKTTASPHTMRKAFITSQQLGRRYKLVYGYLSLGPGRLNMAKVARWYSSQPEKVKTAMEVAEPFSWLRHLEKSGMKPSNRLPWHLTALIMEEYIHLQIPHRPMATIPEDPTSSPDIATLPQIADVKSSRNPPARTLGPSLSRKQSFDDRISFEPLTKSSRNSLGADSRKSSESVHSSGLSGSPNHNPAVIVAPLSPGNPPESQEMRHWPQNDSDAFSVRNSLSEWSSDGGRSRRKTHHQPRPSDLELLSEHEPGPEPSTTLVVSREPSEVGDILPKNEISPSIDSPPTDGDRHLPAIGRPLTNPPAITHRMVGWHRVRMSLPSSDQLVVGVGQKRQPEADEEKVHQEYEIKAQLLDDMIAQNYRIRQLLNRVTSVVKEFELVQSTVLTSLGLPCNHLPKDLLDAFGHDPAAVTGATRRFRGWRAVDDIHKRLIRQRETFRNFLSHAKENTCSPLVSVFDDPVSAVLRSLESLEVHRREITAKANAVAHLLKQVQTIHVNVKAEYNDTLSHTSVVYPELSHIVELEERYKDQYQQFWEFGMDALTFLLDTVTPFWRTYGKTIGEDVQDFLIIPLYRNEFTGEAKRYQIKKFPRRSFRHWMGLMLFFFLSAAINLLQARAALSSSAHYRLLWIGNNGIRWTAMPFFWIGILIQWCAVITEFFIVLMQLGVLTWWIGWSVKIFS